MTHPNTNQTIPHPLLTDLLDQALSLPEVARRHDRPLAELAEILQSPQFAAAAAEFAEAVARRQAWLRPVVRSEALAAVCRVMGQEITSAARAESVRKAVGMVLRWEDEPMPEPHAAGSAPGAGLAETGPAAAAVNEQRVSLGVEPITPAPDRPITHRNQPDAAPAGHADGFTPDTAPAAWLHAAAGQGRAVRSGGIGSLRFEELEALVSARVPAEAG